MADNKILIVDDDNRNIFALSAVLKSKGYKCVSATGGEEGLDLLKKEKGIAVVLMDMMMPGMDGYQAMAEMNDHPELKDIPVIAVTAQAMVGDRERCINAGAVGYVSKPINVEELTRLLTQYI
ncbi:CheY chemotaxis protein or a CheY-like REC (receiver) domain [Pedobacter steynii]|jgi:two-component system cell cycle response regulator DivK|uniref:CheY chemotaxis protein or a CheY-like REC (Receiver) domain n=1 Tax=Pedobacter steynii TaxID=430522 RepID=A0A1H0DWC2_9SPHI|nr:response regulator [Pedobacter steynii]NQX41857.1 response regulator [Pedobacter steynii]SDN74567.1 CheY chemotaxis protein or a CheY-like REC (receiver) domain [Pedobacter steynii]